MTRKVQVKKIFISILAWNWTMTWICLQKSYRYVEKRYGTIMCKKNNAQICYAKWKTSRLTVCSALPDGDFRRHKVKESHRRHINRKSLQQNKAEELVFQTKRSSHVWSYHGPWWLKTVSNLDSFVKRNLHGAFDCVIIKGTRAVRPTKHQQRTLDFNIFTLSMCPSVS